MLIANGSSSLRFILVSMLLAFPIAASAGGPVKLNDDTMRLGGLGSFMQVSPDGQCVVFTADNTAGDLAALYSIPINGGTATQLYGSTMLLDNYPNQPWPDPDGVVARFRPQKKMEVTPDGQYVVFTTEPGVGQVSVNRIPIAGGGVTHLTDITSDSVPYLDFQVSPNGQQVVYGYSLGSQQMLGSVPANGSGAGVQLFSDTVTPGSKGWLTSVQTFPVISPDSSHVAYWIGTGTALRSIPIPGGTFAILSNGTPDGWYIGLPSFTPDSSRVFFSASESSMVGNPSTYFYSVPSGVGAPTHLLTSIGGPGVPILPEGSVGLIGSSAIVTCARGTDNVVFRQVPVDGSPASIIGTVAVDPSVVFQYGYQPLHSMTGMVATATDSGNNSSVYYIPFTGTAAVVLAQGIPGRAGGLSIMAMSGMTISNDDSMAVLGATDTAGNMAIWSVPVGGGAAVRLDQPTADGSLPYRFTLTPDSRYVVYSTGTFTGTDILIGRSNVSVGNLFVVDIHGGPAVQLNNPLGLSDELSWDGTVTNGNAVFMVGNSTDGYNLYSAVVPEPATLSLLALGSLAALRRGRRRCACERGCGVHRRKPRHP